MKNVKIITPIMRNRRLELFNVVLLEFSGFRLATPTYIHDAHTPRIGALKFLTGSCGQVKRRKDMATRKGPKGNKRYGERS